MFSQELLWYARYIFKVYCSGKQGILWKSVILHFWLIFSPSLTFEYLLLPSSELAKFKYIRQSFKLDFLRNYLIQ